MATKSTHYDVLILGAGNAGLAAASVARAADRTVLVAESRDVGGTCPLRGCVPKKVLVAAAESLDNITRAGVHHIKVNHPTLDWSALIERERSFVDGVPHEFEASLAKRGIDLVCGKARFVDRNSVQIGGQIFLADRIVVATGSRPRPLPIQGFEHALTSEDLLERRNLPSTVAFIGAGVIAFEFAHVLARAGVKVTLLEAAPAPLGGLDQDAVAHLAAATRRLGVSISTGVRVNRIEPEPHSDFSGFHVHFEEAGECKMLEAEIVVNGAGRVANLEDLDLAAADIKVDRGQTSIDSYLRSTTNQAVFFAGDSLPGVPQLSPVATYEGRIAGQNLLLEPGEPMQSPNYTSIPSVVFTVPPLASVGLKEKDAHEQGLEFDVAVNDMHEWRSARTYAETDAWSKVLVEKKTGRILGAHLLGHGAAETIHTFALAISHELTSEDLAQTVYAYPTFHSDIKYLV